MAEAAPAVYTQKVNTFTGTPDQVLKHLQELKCKRGCAAWWQKLTPVITVVKGQRKCMLRCVYCAAELTTTNPSQ